jgi:hypothetical protein
MISIKVSSAYPLDSCGRSEEGVMRVRARDPSPVPTSRDTLSPREKAEILRLLALSLGAEHVPHSLLGHRVAVQGCQPAKRATSPSPRRKPWEGGPINRFKTSPVRGDIWPHLNGNPKGTFRCHPFWGWRIVLPALLPMAAAVGYKMSPASRASGRCGDKCRHPRCPSRG